MSQKGRGGSVIREGKGLTTNIDFQMGVYWRDGEGGYNEGEGFNRAFTVRVHTEYWYKFINYCYF